MMTSKSRKGNKEHQLLYENQSKAIIENLQQQLNASVEKIKTYESEINELKTSIASREQELARANTQTLNLSANPTAAGSPAAMMSLRSSGADIANKRIIDQLNSHVDFLNEQLALRETQIQQLHNQITESDELKMELESK